MSLFSLWMMALSGLNMALAVTLGAFGAHALRARADTLPLERGLAVWETAVQYHLIHGLALLAVGVALHFMDSSWLRWSGGLMLAGIVLFSGSLYLMTLTGWRMLGPVTPIGGLCFILAWLALAMAALRAISNH
ncbi:uncharacterized membrane protein YgdD (TMEM256/DUF423 family) [Natronospira proteinivora]|uniref:Uncharacterized membrane protein YgdD (TMEM256/DUF423 family) n=1 Tax=Natronospira proteinivora TaxID=1807133 RepID=A0ABT1GAT8_9GAMM|nr:DUF423 domain-containing protein [Natronospira proteinivora]MCP1728430.1 uncharacterized membrane protein YgdD (TMEM256/DUF423 family) [Natronospira proteinivora]